MAQQCSGMYSKNSWGGNLEPSIKVRLTPSTNHGDIVSLVIFEYRDEDRLGIPITGTSDQMLYICSQTAIKEKACKKEDEGKFIVSPRSKNAKRHDARVLAGGPGVNGTSIRTVAMHPADKSPVSYKITKTGYYCIWALAYNPSNLDFSGVVVFQNAYGELPASQIAKLPFYGGITIVYAVIGALWAFLYVQHRHDILPVQNYITAIIVFLIVEMATTWAYYDYMNVHGSNAVSGVLMTVVSVFNAGRNSFSFFLLLIVCMGYGVVKPSLGSRMKPVRVLAVLHFTFGVVYSVASLTIPPEMDSPFVLLVILPLSGTLTAFYILTLNSLKQTMKELKERKQHQKGHMYNCLWWSLAISMIAIFGFFFVNSLTLVSRSSDFASTYWGRRWFVLDGWLNVVYLANLTTIAYLWRPTANNRRFALSDELAQDDDGAGGFEIASIGAASDDDDDDDDGDGGRGGRNRNPTPDVEWNSANRGNGGPPQPPPPQQQQPQPQQGRAAMTGGEGTGAGTARRGGRASIEEPIFELGEGEEDGWSDGEVMSSASSEGGANKKGKGGAPDDDERKHLTGKKD